MRQRVGTSGQGCSCRITSPSCAKLARISGFESCLVRGTLTGSSASHSNPVLGRGAVIRPMRGWPGGRLGQAARVQGFGQIPAANIGLTILGRGEFSIILAALAASAGLDPRIGPFVALYVLILAVLGPLLAARSRSFARLLPASLFPATAGPGPPRIPE